MLVHYKYLSIGHILVCPNYCYEYIITYNIIPINDSPGTISLFIIPNNSITFNYRCHVMDLWVPSEI